MPGPISHVIVSDLHLGSRHCRVDDFVRLLDNLPPDSTLVLNGDTLDHSRRRLPQAHQQAFDRLRQETKQRAVVWLEGNHDDETPRECLAGFELARNLRLGAIEICHGHDLPKTREDSIFKPGFGISTTILKIIYKLLTCWQRRPQHVAEFAKRWPALYQILTRRQKRRALALAGKENLSAVVCGHVHAPECSREMDCHYLVTGAWTERDNRIALLVGDALSLVSPEALSPPDPPPPDPNRS